MLVSSELGAVARRIQAAQEGGYQVAPVTSQYGEFDVSSAYAVANLIHKNRMGQGAEPVGRKIGFTNPDMWSLYGVAGPIWAYLYNTTVVQIKGQSCRCSLGRFTEPKIEPEIVLHFHSAPPRGSDLQAILGCIDWVAHGFEIVQSHFPDWQFQAADAIADWALHGTLLIGEPRPVDRLAPDLIDALKTFSVDLSCDGVLRETGIGSNVLGSPLLAIAHLVSVLAKQAQYLPIQAGELVTTGTITTAHSVCAGESWRTKIDGIALPGMHVEFEP